MTFTSYLSEQLVDFVEVYKKYFKKTYSTCLVFTVCLFVCMALFVRFGNNGLTSNQKQFSLLGYFLLRYSTGDVYAIVDLSKLIFIFFVSMFSISISRNEDEHTEQTGKKSIVGNIRFADVAPLIFILLVSSGIDYGLTKLHGLFELKLNSFSIWACSFILQLRIYIPLFLFAIMIYQLRTDKYPKITFKKILFLFVTLWLFNEFAYEMAIFVKTHIFNLLLIPYGETNTYIEESLLALPLVAFWFLGFHSALNSSLRIMDEPDMPEIEKDESADDNIFPLNEPH